MRIGELLRARGWVDPADLDRALAEQRHTRLRLCSLLIARGLLDPDVAARALSEQHGVAAALARHLENRDPAIANRISSELARSMGVLPIGRGRGGELVVCARDPRPTTMTALAQATREPILLAVAPALLVDRLIDQTYGAQAHDEFDVDLSTGPVDVPPDLASRPARAASVPGALELDDAPASEAAAEGLGLLGQLTLVELDDARVAKDPTQSGQFAIPRALTPNTPPTPPTPPAPTPPPPQPVPSSPPPAQVAAFAEGTSPPGKGIVIPERPRPSQPVLHVPPIAPATGEPAHVEHLIAAPSLDDTLVQLERCATRDAATDIAMAFARGHWQSALLLTIKEGAALGHRGHGGHLSDDAIQGIAIPLATATIVRAAHDARRLVTEPPPKGAIQDRLARMLGNPTSPAAAPIFVGVRIACVLVVGDPRDRAVAPSDLALDLDDLAVALGSAYARIVRETKR